MTRATRNRVEQRLKRKGDKSPYDAGYAKGWAQGRMQLANALASPEGFPNTENGDVFRMVRHASGVREMVEGDIMEAADPGEAIERQLELQGIPT
jgi:hypothetical protein